MSSTPRLRSFLAAATSVGLALSLLGSCGSSDNNAFTLNGAATSKDTAKKLAQAIIDDQIVDPVNNDISGADMRTLLTWLIQNDAAKNFFASVGESITDEDKATTIENNQANFDGLGELTTEFFATHESINAVWSRVMTPSEAEAKKLYETSPARSGSLCLSHILVTTEKEAKDIVKQLNGGAKFADVAKSKSIDTGSGSRGGVLGSTETNDCMPNSVILEKFDAQFNAGALKAKLGDPSDPIKTQFGWHIILHREWSEVKDSVMENLSSNAGREMYIGYLMSAKISVNPTYGKWDPVSLTVINPNSSTSDTTEVPADEEAPADTSNGEQ